MENYIANFVFLYKSAHINYICYVIFLCVNRFLFYIFLLFALPSQGIGQSSVSLVPFSEQYQLSPVVDFINMPEYDYSRMITEDKASMARGEKRYRFAKKIPVDIVPFNEGVWEEVPNGGRVWRIGIRSFKAHSLYVVLRSFELSKGVTIFAYNSAKTESHGPFSYTYNNDNKLLVIPPVQGSEVIIELNVDAGVDNFGEFAIAEVWHDYRNIRDNSRLKSYKAGSCNLDINCEEGVSWQLEKRAVGKIIANGEYCTGTLINNVAGKKIPYFITAYHCIEDANIASTALYYFDYERTACNGSVISSPKIVYGSELKSTTPNQLDFTLVKLNRFPAITDGLYLAGWDARFNNPAGGVSIHHPSGDVKKISIANTSLYTANFGEGFNQDSHWLVSRWDVGTTEGGSSGGPFFDNQHHLVGTLSGGDANCKSPVNDYFTKFALAWDYYTDSARQLKCWLDPENTGVRVLAGQAPYGLFKPDCDTVSNMLSTEEPVNAQTGSRGYMTGHNSYTDTEFAEKFTLTNPTAIPGFFVVPSLISVGNAFSSVTFKIWSGNDMPQQEIYSKPYYLKNLEPGALNFIEFDSLVQLSGTFFIGYVIAYNTPADTMALYHALNRNSGLATAFVKRNQIWENLKDINSYYTSLAISFSSCEPLENPVIKDVKLYPNPAYTDITVEFPITGEITDVACFNVLGQKQPINWWTETAQKFMVDVQNLKDGVYGIRFRVGDKEYVKQFVVIKQP